MTTSDSSTYTIVIGFVSIFGSFFGAIAASYITSKATRSSASATLEVNLRQITFQRAAKMADFRQAWINDLRESMARFHALGVTPDLDQTRQQEFYEFGTKIELAMNRQDPNYKKLINIMYDFLRAKTTEEKFRCNAPFTEVCQDILKAEWEVLKANLAEANKAH